MQTRPEPSAFFVANTGQPEMLWDVCQGCAEDNLAFSQRAEFFFLPGGSSLMCSRI